MSAVNSPKDRINILKKRARKISKKQSISQAAALATIAKSEGYDSWFSCNNAVRNGAPITQSPPSESSTPTPGNSRRLTLLDYTGEFFETKNSLRNRLEREIKDSLKRSKGAKLNVKLYLSIQQIEQIGDVDFFFESILNRFDRLQRIELQESDPSDSPLLDLLSDPALRNKGE